MLRKCGFKAVLLTFLLIIPLMLGATSSVYAGKPEQPGGGKVSGKAIDAVLTSYLVDNGDGSWSNVAIIVGSCGKTPVAFGPETFVTTPAEFAATTVEDLVDMFIPEAGPPGCYSPEGGEDLVVTRMRNFNNTGTAIGAEVSVQVIVITSE